MADASATWPDAAGRIVAGVHRLAVRIYYEDTDFSGIVYHANYLRYCERGRSDLLRLAGVHHAAMHAGEWGDGQLNFAVTAMEMRYLRPARIDDLLEVRTSFIDIGGARFSLDQRVVCGEHELFVATVHAAVLGAGGKPRRLPGAMRDALKATGALGPGEG